MNSVGPLFIGGKSINRVILLKFGFVQAWSLKAGKGKVIKARTVKSSLQLVDEPDEEQDQPEVVPEPQGAGKEYDLERAIQMILESFQAQGQAHVDGVAIHEDQAGSDPGKSHMALVGPNPEPMHDYFIATVYPKVHESLKFLADEQVILEDPPSLSRTLSSMKNLDDTYTFRDQFFNEKSTEDEHGKQNVDAEVVSMKSQTLDNATQNLGSKVFNLEHWDLPHKINQTVNKVIKEAVYISLQASLRDRFKELPEADMKEILHQQMFESGSYKSLPEHVALYEALEASMERTNMDEFLSKKDMSRKRRCDDQDPPPSLPDSDLSKMKRYDSDTSRSKQPLTPQSSAWKASNTREAPSSSSKQQSAPHLDQPFEDVPIPDDVNISDLEDTDTTHLPNIKTRPDWLKPLPEEDKPETPEPNWIISLTDLPEAKNN
nr:hypothetical protein [Tanacetum cinerariifolium]